MDWMCLAFLNWGRILWLRSSISRNIYYEKMTRVQASEGFDLTNGLIHVWIHMDSQWVSEERFCYKNEFSLPCPQCDSFGLSFTSHHKCSASPMSSALGIQMVTLTSETATFPQVSCIIYFVIVMEKWLTK